MLGQLSTTCSNVLKQPNGELLVAVNHNQLRTMASETYWLTQGTYRRGESISRFVLSWRLFFRSLYRTCKFYLQVYLPGGQWYFRPLAQLIGWGFPFTTCNPIDLSHLPPSWAVPLVRLVHIINQCNRSIRGNHLNCLCGHSGYMGKLLFRKTLVHEFHI